MLLDSDLTGIEVVEQAVSDRDFVSPQHTVRSTYWTAELNGHSVDGHHVEMSRDGATPDEAIKNLFEAMTEAEITL